VDKDAVSKKKKGADGGRRGEGGSDDHEKASLVLLRGKRKPKEKINESPWERKYTKQANRP